MKSFRVYLILCCLAVSASAQSFVLDPIATGTVSVTYITHAGDNSGRLFVVTQNGLILIHDGSEVLSTPFLNLTQKVSCCGERGLFTIAFHPDYINNGFFFVNYTDLAGDTQISRFSVSAGDKNQAGTAETLILNISQPFENHNGGQLQFGPDGYLYIGTGDGGLFNDPGNRSQDINNLLGKMLRLDVDGALPYEIPTTNPFVGSPGADEIWAYGLRNPWRFSFDRITGDLFIADVGQDQWEEINFQPASSSGCDNYGWRRMEGSQCYIPSTDCEPAATNSCNVNGEMTLPVYEYGHTDQNCSVTGGYRYRGSEIDELKDMYLFADFCSGKIWGAEFNPDMSGLVTELMDTNEFINTFGEDEQGELYIGTSSGTVFRITPSIRISPPTGTYGSTQNFDILLSIYDTDIQLPTLNLQIDDNPPIVGLPSCVVIGTLSGGGTTLRCPFPPSNLDIGTHVISLSAETGDAQTFKSSVIWNIESVNE